MKKFIFLIVAFFMVNVCNAQDTLILKTGVKIQAKVIETNNLEVKYLKFENLNGPTFSILKSELVKISYESGINEVFNDVKDGNSFLGSDKALFAKGQNDAVINYKAYKPAGITVLVATSLPFYGFIVGLVPAVAFTAIPPTDENLGYQDPNLMQNDQYANGYKKKASQIKKKKVLNNYLIGLGVCAAASLAIAVIALGSVY